MKVFFCFIFFLLISNHAFSQNDTNAVKAIHAKLQVFQEKEQIDSIWFYENKALQISERINYENGKAHAYSSFGVIYKIRGDFAKSLENFFKALTIYEKQKNEYRILVQYSGIASVYYYQNDLQKALTYYLKAIDLSKKLGDEQIESNNLCNVAGLYNSLGEFDKAEKCLLRALEIDREMKNEIGMTHELADLGELYFDMKQYAKSLTFAGDALALAERIGYRDILPSCYLLSGRLYMKLNNKKQAEACVLKALKLAEESDEIHFKMLAELTLSDFYDREGKTKESLTHFRKYIQYKDSMFNEENTRKSVESEMTYKFDKKQAALKFEHEKEIYELEAENKLHKQLRLFLIIFIGLILVLLVIGKRAYDNKKKIAEFMSSENMRKEVLLQEVHHRINNNLQIISSLLTLQANSADNEKLQEYLLQSQNRIQSLSVLHELLYQNDSPLKINMRDYLNKVLDFHKEVINTLPFEIDMSVEVEEVSFPTKVAVPLALIINELVTNAIKYAFSNGDKGWISVSLLQLEKNKWKLKVSDSGKGLPDDSQMRANSLGLRLTSIMAKQIKASITRHNSPGATFEILFELKQDRV